MKLSVSRNFILFIIVLLFVGYLSPLAMAQVKDVLKEKVDTENKPTPKKDDEAAGKDTKGNEQNKKTDGKADFTYNPNQPLDSASFGKPNTMVGKKGEKEEEKEKEKPPIDTTLFLKRSAVKKRDLLAYGRGLPESTSPIIHVNRYTKKHTLQKGKYVFGWHPYWMGEAYKSYNYSLLSVIAYFSYELNPLTGGYKSVHDWQTTPLIKEAQKHKTKVLLSLSSLIERDNELFLNNKQAQAKCIATLIDLVLEAKGNGVHLDLEQIPKKQKEALTNFVIDLSSKLRSSVKGAWLTMSLPAADFDLVYDVKQLNPHVDLFVINGNEFYGANTDIAGPVALAKGGSNWWAYSLDRSIDEYIAAGADPAKLLMSVNYYGAEWQTEGLEFPAKAQKFIGYSMYRDIQQKLGFASPYEEPLSMSNYFVYRDNNNKYRQIWYDDSLALAKKYDWIVGKKIAGVGIWALGYDNNNVKLWQALAAKFADKPAADTKNAQVTIGTITKILNGLKAFLKNPAAALKNPMVFLGMFGILLTASLTSLFLLYRNSCNWSRTTNLVVKIVLSFLGVLLICLLLIGGEWATLNTATYIIVGYLVGLMVFLFLAYRYLMESELP